MAKRDRRYSKLKVFEIHIIKRGNVCSELVTAMDFLPTFARLTGVKVPDDRIIDGKDIWDLITEVPGAHSPYDAFYYYWLDNLEAIRVGPWKLHISRNEQPICELYNLEKDIGETTNVAKEHPDIVKMIMEKADLIRKDIGDAVVGAEGDKTRPIGRVDNPKPLTQYDENHPYIMALYDIPYAG
jgi:arylsulfatase A-like enzyme